MHGLPALSHQTRGAEFIFILLFFASRQSNICSAALLISQYCILWRYYQKAAVCCKTWRPVTPPYDAVPAAWDSADAPPTVGSIADNETMGGLACRLFSQVPHCALAQRPAMYSVPTVVHRTCAQHNNTTLASRQQRAASRARPRFAALLLASDWLRSLLAAKTGCASMTR